jgi:hypothetical protein
MLNCAEFEIVLADYLDGALTGARQDERDAFLRHRESCDGCASMARDVQSAMAFMERAAEPEPPAALLSKILHATNSGWELKLRGAGVRGWINRVFAPVLRPRVVLGAVFTLMSLTMLTQCAGGPKSTLTAADLDPVRIWTALDNKTQRIYDRAIKGYESMRLVYVIKTQLNDWSQQQNEQDEAAADARANTRKLDQPTVSQEKAPQEKGK